MGDSSDRKHDERRDGWLDARTTIRRAGRADVDAVLAVVHDATRRVQEMGFPQWKLYLTDEGAQSVRDKVNGIDGMEAYVAERDGCAVGAFSVQWSDRDCWADLGDDGKAGYVHMLAVHRCAKRDGLGERMLAWAEQLIAGRGREFCRLDCWRGSTFLTSYYPRLGYAVLTVPGAPKGVMNFQKPVSP